MRNKGIGLRITALLVCLAAAVFCLSGMGTVPGADKTYSTFSGLFDAFGSVTSLTQSGPVAAVTIPDNATDEDIENTYSCFGDEPALNFSYTAGEYSELSQDDYYCYSRLSELQKSAYKKLYTAAQTMNEQLFVVGRMEERDACIALMALRTDWPQIFWLDSMYGIGRDSRGNVYLSFCGDGYGFTVSASRRQTMYSEMTARISAACTECLSAEMSAWERELALHDWLCENAEYDTAAADNPDRATLLATPESWTAYGVLVKGRGVCESFSRAFQLLLYTVGITSTLVFGKTSSGGAHMWNEVLIGKSWYITDVTWDNSQSGSLDYTHTYFNINDSDASRDRTPSANASSVEDDKKLIGGDVNIDRPECTSDEAGYSTVMGTRIASEADFSSVVAAKLVYALRRGESSVEFRLDYKSNPDTAYIKSACNKYDVLGTVRHNLPGVSGLKYAALGDFGCFYITVS